MTTTRAEWLRVLALVEPDALETIAAPVLADFRFERLRGPESGLVMVRARIGNTGDRFNVGEATVTRCSVRHIARNGRVIAGVGHVAGRDGARAERIAQLDALLQDADVHALVLRTVVAPLHAAIEARHRQERATTEATRVRFFALQPETSA